MARSVVFAPEAETDLIGIYEYIARHGGPERSLRFVERIVAACQGLAMFPERASLREDIRPGLRVTSHARRVTIAFHIDEAAVTIDRILAAGRDLENVFNDV